MRAWNFQDLTGEKYGRLTVITLAPKRCGHTYWLCRCECGNECEVEAANLTREKQKSCGCLRTERIAALNRKHSMSHTRLFNIWQMMLRRCENSRGHDVQNYQERGISVCREWHDFDEFMRWAITSGYRNDLTVDRINNNGNYCPANCRWADNYTQANNTRRNIWIEYNGEKKTVAQWARELGINYFCLHERWKKGWSAEQCLFGRDSA